MVALLAEEVAGVEVALAPGLLGVLLELPVIETGTEAAGDRLMLLPPCAVPAPPKPAVDAVNAVLPNPSRAFCSAKYSMTTKTHRLYRSSRNGRMSSCRHHNKADFLGLRSAISFMVGSLHFLDPPVSGMAMRI